MVPFAVRNAAINDADGLGAEIACHRNCHPTTRKQTTADFNRALTFGQIFEPLLQFGAVDQFEAGGLEGLNIDVGFDPGGKSEVVVMMPFDVFCSPVMTPIRARTAS